MRWVYVACALFSASIFADTSVLRFEGPKSIDFGVRRPNQETSHVFHFTNVTQTKIHLAGVKTSCGCTTATLRDVDPSGWLMPGQSAQIHARFNTDNGMRGKKGATLTLVMDSPRYEEFQVSVHGMIRADLQLDPSEARFNSVRSSQGSHIDIQVARYGRPNFRVVSGRSADPRLQLGLGQTKQEQGWTLQKIRLSIEAGVKAGDLNANVTLQTSEGETLTIPVFGQVVTGIVGATDLSMSGNAGEVLTKKIVIQGEKPFAIQEIRSKSDALTFEFDAQAERKVHTFTVRYQSSEAGKYQDEITVLGNDGSTGTLPLQILVN